MFKEWFKWPTKARAIHRIRPFSERIYLRLEARRLERELEKYSWRSGLHFSAQAQALRSDRDDLWQDQKAQEDEDLVTRAKRAGVILETIDCDLPESPAPYRASEKWMWLDIDTGRKFLKPEFVTPLLKAIAQAEPARRKERRETIELWFKGLTGLSGVIGALIGLVAVWKAK